ncbi:DUF6531 domain-containing protein [Pseudomonas sp. HMSC063H08]|nr:DUF6531 domain-containing protein [Pseudomonas sp. HMSC063H08]
MTKPPLDSEPPRTYSSLVLCIAAAFSTMTYASPGAILEPKKKYKFANDTFLTIIEETLTEVILKINEKQEKIFKQCTSKAVYSCTKFIITHAEGSEIFGKTNGEYNSHSLIRHSISQSINAAGIVTINPPAPAGSLGTQTVWTCPEDYWPRSETIAPKQIRKTCVIKTQPAKNKGPSDISCPSPYGGNPINFAIGNKYQEEIDLRGGRGNALILSRNYNSLDGYWRHNFSMRLDIDLPRSTIYLTRETGRLNTFSLNNGTITAEATELGSLIKLDNRWIYSAKNNDQFIFNDRGALIRQNLQSGVQRSISYSQNKVFVTDNFGNSLELTQDENNQPLGFRSSSVEGRYDYSTSGQLIKSQVTLNGVSKTRLYHYEDEHNPRLLTGLTDERGIRFATWSYDDQGRAISSEHAGGMEKIQIVYNNDGSTTVTNELGKVTRYRFQNLQGLQRIIAIIGEPSVDCPSSNSSFTYTSRGQLASKRDNNGNLTTYQYNARGLETSRTEAAGTAQTRTITTDWHPTLFLPVQVSEPGRITRYQYDAEGRKTGETVTTR